MGPVTRVLVTVRHPDYALLGFVSALFFLLEIVLFSGLRFVTGYFEAQLAIALGLLGLLVGGAVATCVSERRASSVRRFGTLSLSMSPVLAFGSVLIAQPLFWVAALLALVAFVPLGVLIGIVYRDVNVRVGYAVELVAGVGGFAIALLALRYLREEGAFVVAALSAALFALGYLRGAGGLMRSGLVGVVVLLLVVFGTNLQRDYLNLVEVAHCDLTRPHAVGKIICFKEVPYAYALLRSEGSIMARVDIIALRTAAGPLVITSFAGDQNDAVQAFGPEAYAHDARLPDVGAVDDALIIGAGVEGVVKAVRADGVARITALELNGTVVDLWRRDRELREYAHEPFANAELVHADGRAYLAASDRDFDLITLMNTHRAPGAGSLGEPDFLHTREALRRMYERLSHEGSLVIEERLTDEVSVAAVRRILGTLRTALIAAGVADPAEHVALYAWTSLPSVPEGEHSPPAGVGRYFQIVVQKRPIMEEDRARLMAWADVAARADTRMMPTSAVFGEWIWLPEVVTEGEGERMQFIAALTGSSSVATITDNQPFAFRVEDTSSRVAVSAAAAFSTALALALGWWLWRTRGKSVRRRTALPLFFSLIGFGYMGFEVFFIAVFQQVLGSVLLALVASIAGMLLASAAGAALLGRFCLAPVLWLLAPLIAGGAALTTLLLPQAAVGGTWYAFPLAFGLAALAGGSLGAFFPWGVACARDGYACEVPLLVGLNGAALALAVPLAFLVAVGWGLAALAALSVALYILAVVVRLLAH